MLTLPHQGRDGVAAGQHSLSLPREYLCHLQQHVVGQNIPEIKRKATAIVNNVKKKPRFQYVYVMLAWEFLSQ